MDYKKSTIIFSALAALTSSSFAADYWFRPASSNDVTWMSLSNWYTSTDEGETFTPATILPAETDNITFDYSKTTAYASEPNVYWLIDGNTSVNDLNLLGDWRYTKEDETTSQSHFELKSIDRTSDTKTETTFTVNGNFTRTLNGSGGYGSNYFSSGEYNALSVDIKGNATFKAIHGILTFSLGGWNQRDALKSLKIGGDLKISAGQISLGSMLSERDSAKIAKDKYYYYKNADIQVGGNMIVAAEVFLNPSGAKARTISVNGLTNGGYYAEVRAQNNGRGTVGANTTLVFANKGVASFKGGLTDLDSYGASEGVGKSNAIIDVVMMGTTGSQQKLIISTNKRAFRGGVTVLSGDLRMFTYYQNNTEEGQWGKWGDIRLVGNSDGVEAKFGAVGTNGEAIDTNALVYADNLVWTSGTIVSGIISKTQASLIQLSGTMIKGEGAGDKFWFDFTGNTNYLAEDGVSLKLISWSDGSKPTDFVESQFKADKIDDKIANFEIKSDGLYVSYTSVPEPSTIAAIFGIFALAFATWRKRK